jgi:hypothetical protein
MTHSANTIAFNFLVLPSWALRLLTFRQSQLCQVCDTITKTFVHCQTVFRHKIIGGTDIEHLDKPFRSRYLFINLKLSHVGHFHRHSLLVDRFDISSLYGILKSLSCSSLWFWIIFFVPKENCVKSLLSKYRVT